MQSPEGGARGSEWITWITNVCVPEQTIIFEREPIGGCACLCVGGWNSGLKTGVISSNNMCNDCYVGKHIVGEALVMRCDRRSVFMLVWV